MFRYTPGAIGAGLILYEEAKISVFSPLLYPPFRAEVLASSTSAFFLKRSPIQCRVGSIGRPNNQETTPKAKKLRERMTARLGKFRSFSAKVVIFVISSG